MDNVTYVKHDEVHEPSMLEIIGEDYEWSRLDGACKTYDKYVILL